MDIIASRLRSLQDTRVKRCRVLGEFGGSPTSTLLHLLLIPLPHLLCTSALILCHNLSLACTQYYLNFSSALSTGTGRLWVKAMAKCATNDYIRWTLSLWMGAVPLFVLVTGACYGERRPAIMVPVLHPSRSSLAPYIAMSRFI